MLTEPFAHLKTIPPISAEVECVWSSFSHILDDRSLLVAKETLECRLQIKYFRCMLNQFDPTDAVHLWWSDTSQSRWPNFKYKYLLIFSIKCILNFLFAGGFLPRILFLKKIHTVSFNWSFGWFYRSSLAVLTILLLLLCLYLNFYSIFQHDSFNFTNV